MTRQLPAAILVLASAVACGKQGPPLAPFVHIPAAVEPISARRVGGDVFLTMTVPIENVDGSTPVDIGRIEVYAYTGRTAPSIRRLIDWGSLVAEVEIGGSQDVPQPGEVVTVRDQLSPEALQAAVAPPAVARQDAPVLLPSATTAPLRRYYGALAFSPRGRPGPPQSSFTAIVLAGLPDPPDRLRADYSASSLTLAWQPSGGVVGFLMERPLPLLPPDGGARTVASQQPPDQLPPPPTRYNVYRQREPDPLALALPVASVGIDAPVAINPAPITSLSYVDDVQFERRGCYTVRAVRGTGAAAVESEPSEPLCVRPIDVFPPAPPRSLAAVPSDRAVSLIWELNDEADLAGYLVLRGEPGDATLHPLTPTPVAEPRYRDTDVTPGVNYVYAVVAVDNRLPAPNVSAESNKVEERAR